MSPIIHKELKRKKEDCREEFINPIKSSKNAFHIQTKLVHKISFKMDEFTKEIQLEGLDQNQGNFSLWYSPGNGIYKNILKKFNKLPKKPRTPINWEEIPMEAAILPDTGIYAEIKGGIWINGLVYTTIINQFEPLKAHIVFMNTIGDRKVNIFTDDKPICKKKRETND